MVSLASHPDEFDVDLCIVGAGPAGITLARELVGKRMRVLLVESGGFEAGDRPLEESGGECVGHPYFDLTETRASGFGGSSFLWPEGPGLRSRPLDPIDFETRPGIPDSGWPFGAEELEPCYRRAHQVAALGPPEYAAAAWSNPKETPLLPLRREPFETVVFKFGGDIGVFRAYRAELEKAENVTLRLHTTVERLVCDHDPDRVDRIVLVDRSGRRSSLRARVFVLAAGGIENARLLLLSRDAHAEGLGNRHDLVGRYFQEHLRVNTGILVPEDLGIPDRLGFYSRHERDGMKVTGALALTPDKLRADGLLNTAIYLRTETELRASDAVRSLAVLRDAIRGSASALREGPASHLRNLLARPVSTGRALAGLGLRRPGRRVVRLGFQTEQAPNPDSRVVLGERRDALGRPVARLDWSLTDLDLGSVRRIQEILDEECRKAGVGRIERMLGEERPPAPVSGFLHHIGTTRMHPSPRRGVVDADGRIHGVSNVFVTGSSVFPTGGYANPTLTVVALALRLADHLSGLPRLRITRTAAAASRPARIEERE